MLFRSLIFLAPFVLVLITGCSRTKSEPKANLRSAFELHLPTAGDRRDLLTILDRVALVHGMHVDVGRLGRHMDAVPANSIISTTEAEIWLGGDETDRSIQKDPHLGNSPTGLVIDLHDGRSWLVFLKGSDDQRASIYRDEVTRQILKRWPSTRPVALLPDGSLPPFHKNVV